VTFDALQGGVKDWGPWSIRDIRTLVCYLLNTLGQAISHEDFVEIFIREGLVNYFEIGDALSELVKGGSIHCEEIDGRQMYSITETGIIASNELLSDLHISVRERAAAAALRLFSRRRSEKEHAVEITENGKGFLVILTVRDLNTELMSIRVPVADLTQANLLRDRFYDDPGAVYTGTLALLTGDLSLLTEYLNNK
jgi:predicted transcriptional regulator